MQYKKIRTFLGSVCLILFLYSRNAPANELTGVEIAERADEATVLIGAAPTNLSEIGQGSGFLVHSNLIVTNFHVIKDASVRVYKRSDQVQYNIKDGWVIAYKRVGQEKVHSIKSIRCADLNHDLAILEVLPTRVEPLHLGDSDTAKKGETVYVAGNPHGIEGTVSKGIISGQLTSPGPKFKAFKFIREGVELIQIDASISSGSSGGPVINDQGEVVGVATVGSVVDDAPDLNFAIPSKHLKDLAERHKISLPSKPKPVGPDEEERRDAARAKAKIIKHLKAATVRIIGKDPNGEESLLGIGFYVEPDQVATDFHVIDGAELIGVKRFRQGTKSAAVLLGAKLLKTDKTRHLAILKVEKKVGRPLSLGNSNQVDRDEEIYMVQDPSQGKTSEGTISKILDIEGVQYFQLDAEVLPASSGGPIANIRGEVIAVTALKVPKLDGTLKYAIPAIYLEGLRAKPPDPPPPKPPPEPPDDGPDQPVIPPPENLLKPGVDFYKAAKFGQAVGDLQSVLNRLSEPKQRALAHLYLGFSKWGLEETESSVNAEFREALRYNPSIELPNDVVGQDHPVFKPLLEKARAETTGTLTITASPPETEIEIYGGAVQPKLPDDRTKPIRLFKGNYAVEGVLEGAHKVVPVLIRPGAHKEISLRVDPSPGFEFTLDLISAEKPKKVTVRYTIYDADDNKIDQDEKAMELREKKPPSTWAYHVKLPSAAQGGKIEYRIEADGKVIIDPPPPMQIEILEPPENASIAADQTIPIKARVISNAEISEVRVVYDTPTTLADTSPSQKLEKKSSSNTYIGKIPTGRKHTDGTTWFYVTATNKKGVKVPSVTRAVHAKAPEIVVLKPLETAGLPTNKPIEIKAEVKTSEPLREVRVYHDFPRKQLSEKSPYTVLENKSSGMYIGNIPKERTRDEGYIWYFVMVTPANGLKFKSEDKVVEVKDSPPEHKGVWASHSWSNVVGNEGFYSGWERGNVVSLAFLQEGKGFQTLGARLDYTYENPDYISAIVQWGPSTRENPVSFAFLAGAAGYRSSDPSFSGIRQSSQITPLLGGSLKLFPMDRVTLDVTGSVRLQSENAAANRDANFIEEYLLHYEAGIRLYITPSLNLKAGYGRWRYGEYDNASVQIGLGNTF